MLMFNLIKAIVNVYFIEFHLICFILRIYGLALFYDYYANQSVYQKKCSEFVVFILALDIHHSSK